MSTLDHGRHYPTEEWPKPNAVGILTAALSYAEAEEARLKGIGGDDYPIPDLTPFEDAVQDGQTILFTIEPGYGPHRFDIPMFLHMAAATAFRGFIRLNNRKAPKVLGRSKFHVRMDFPKAGGHPRLNIQANRVVANARPGERVHEGSDYHNHLPEVLTKTPSNDTRTRADVIAAALRHYDATPATHPAKRAIGRDGYKRLLWRLLAIADARWQGRMVRDAVATAPWDRPGLIND